MEIGATAVIAGLACVIWLWLVFLRGGFWRADLRIETPCPRPAAWPGVVAVIPARDEAETIATAVSSILAQDYPGPLAAIVVDDRSEDATAAIVAALAADAPRPLALVAGRPLPEGWTGKPWALTQGVARATEAGSLSETGERPRYLWFSDADIAHDPGVLARLVARAEAEGRVLVSVMALLDHEGFWARLLIPAFVFFFQKLYPFRWVAEPTRKTAAAAGGCVLLLGETLARAGGIAALRDAVIDDCALAARIKPHGPIWLGLTTTTRSLRGYAGLGEIWDMVARGAFTQLRYSPLALVFTVLAMTLVYLAPPAAAVLGAVSGDLPAAALGLAAWALMAIAYAPTLALYGQPAAAGLLLPVAAALYTAMTVSSALRYWRGVGARWKGRVAAPGR